MGGLKPDKGVTMIGDSADLERHARQSADGAAQVFVEVWAPIWLNKGASFFGGADPVVMQVVIGRTHGRRVPAQFYGATPNSSRLNSDGLAPHPGCRTTATSLPGGRRPEKPPATSGYPLATLRVDPFRMSKLQ